MVISYGSDMINMSFFGLILIFLVVGFLVALLCLSLVILLVRKAGNNNPGVRVRNADETKLIQEIHQGLIKMEQRIEALETIVLEAGERSEA